MAMASFLPGGLVTGIGSLPHLEADEAVRFVAQASPQAPFWPQLPQRSPREGMIAQMLSPLLELLTMSSQARFDIDEKHLAEFRRRLCNASPAVNKGSALGFYAFEQACREGSFPQAVTLKGQLTGPVTLAHCLFIGDSPLATIPTIYEELTDYVRRLALWQIERLQPFGLPVLLFVDEPALAMSLAMGAPSPYVLEGLARLLSAIHNTGSMAGVHCCATDTPIEICAARPDIISFDAYAGLEAFLAHPQVHDFVEAGGVLAFGLIPNIEHLDSPHGAVSSEAFVRWVTAAEKFDIHRLGAQSMFTATCGLGLLDIGTAHTSFAEARRLSELVRKTLAGNMEVGI